MCMLKSVCVCMHVEECVCVHVYVHVYMPVFPLGLNSNRVVNITIIEYYYGIYTGHEEGGLLSQCAFG